MDAATALGIPLTWTYQGKKYPIAERDLDWACAFQRHIEECELEGIRRHAEILGSDYPAALDNWQKGVAAGRYEWGGALAWEYYKSASGYKYAAALSLAAGSGMVLFKALELIDAAFDDASPEGKAAWAELQFIQKALNDPNRKRPQPAQAAASA